MTYYDEQPIIDLRQELKKSIRELGDETAADMQKKAAEAQQKFINDAFSETLKEFGVTPEEWQTYLGQDAEGSKKAFREGVRTYVKGVAAGKGKKTAPAGHSAASQQLSPSYKKIEFSEAEQKEFRQSNRGRTSDIEALLRKKG
jgi:phage terminase small subunit